MPPKGKWAQGITPRHFSWIIQDQLAVSERPGGYAANHRRVRRQEEIIWVREQGFTVVSLIPAPNNLHNYDELGVAWRHWPFPVSEDYPRYLAEHYTELQTLIASGAKVLVHHEELADKTIGLVAGYLVWAGLVPEEPKATFIVEHITSRQLSPAGREIVAAATKLAEQR